MRFRLKPAYLILFSCLSIFIFNCEVYPPAKNLLLIDLNMSPSIVHSGMANIFSGQNCKITYRQYYPDIVKDDLTKYDIIAFFAGRSPYIPCAQFNRGAFPYLKRYVKNGGVLLIGTELAGRETTGLHDRKLFNELLSELKIPIQINNDIIADIKNGYSSPLYFRPKYKINSTGIKKTDLPEMIPIDRSPSLNVGKEATVFASGSESSVRLTNRLWLSHLDSIDVESAPNAPVAAGGKYGHGYVFVISKYFYNSISFSNITSGKPLLDIDMLKDTREFLEQFSNFIIDLSDKKGELIPSGIEFDLPADSISSSEITYFENNIRENLPLNYREYIFDNVNPVWETSFRTNEQKYLENVDKDLYSWILKEGIRAGWLYTVTGDKYFKSMPVIMGSAKTNLIWGVCRPQSILSKEGINEKKAGPIIQGWKELDDHLTGSGNHWFMGMNLSSFRNMINSTGGVQGENINFPNPLNQNFWDYEVYEPMKILADFSSSASNVSGIIIDLELYGFKNGIYNLYNGYGFDNSSYSKFLRETNGKMDMETWTSISNVPKEKRISTLMEYGLLERYYSVLETTVEIYAKDIKSRILKINPKIIFGFYQKTLPSTWFSRGILKGFSSIDRPALMFSFESIANPYLQSLRKDFIYILPVSAALMGMFKDFSKVFENAHTYNYGYWLNRASWLTQSADPYDIESPWGRTSQQAVKAIKFANDNLSEKLNGKVTKLFK